VHRDTDHAARHRVVEVLLESLLRLLVPFPDLLLLLANLLLGHGLADDLGAESEELGQSVEELFLFVRGQCLLVL